MASSAAQLAPRRLVLHLDELESLRVLAGGARLPTDFRAVPADVADAPSEERGRDDGLRSLLDRGLITEDGDEPAGYLVHPSLVTNLAVLSAPELLIETRATIGQGSAQRAVRAAHAVSGPLGASLVRTGAGAGVELSAFPAERLGVEVNRAVPEAGPSGHADRRPAGTVALTALVELPIAAARGGAVVDAVAADLQISAEERELALSLAREATGVLQATLSVPTRGPDAKAWIDQVLWHATDGGWVGVAPERDPQGRSVARLVAVEPSELSAWLAPLVGQALVEGSQ
jgi:hypothetical protein